MAVRAVSSVHYSPLMMADPAYTHDSLFSPATLRLGEIHWHILKAATLIDETTHVKQKIGEGTWAIRYEQTEFGKEVGRDEINWWVFKKESNIDELRERTTQALEAGQKLKEASATLKKNKARSYSDLLNALRHFAEDHASEIEALYGYVCWLCSRNTLAPAILYTYRVWGSTRRGDRWPTIDVGAEAPDLGTIHHLTEVVLGLNNSRGLSTLDKAHYEVGEEIWSSMDEETASNTEIKVPMSRVAARASRMAYDECAVYFAEIRDSLRNVLLDIEKFVEQQNLLGSDALWKAVVEKAMRVRTAEPQLWDFKATLPLWHIASGPDRERAKVTFAEDVASFANARGGVLIVGVNDQREVVGIGDVHEVENRLKFASEVLHKHLEYDRPFFHFHQLALSGRDGQEKICLLIIVAQVCGVVGVRDDEGRYTYPVRREAGLKRETRDALMLPKSHMKSDNYDFLPELSQFARDRSA